MFVNHIFAASADLPAMGSHLYEYVVGANGIFVRARRPGLDALIWVASTLEPVRGLAEIAPRVEIASRVPAYQVGRLFEMAHRAQGKEILFYLNPNPWRIQVPEQEQHAVSVRPVDPFAGGTNTLIEVHSHHGMQAFFSTTDDREEQAGFRIYTVIGGIPQRPTMLTRVGIYGHFWEIPSAWVFDLPAGVADGLYADESEVEYVDD